MKTQAEKSIDFVALHERPGAFLTPNPWDKGSARLLESLGFEALAATGAGYAFSQALPDLAINTRGMLPYLQALCEATDVPVTADLQHGFGDSPEEVAAAIRAGAATGIVGGSIEDADGTAAKPIYDIGLATARIEAAAEASRGLSFKFMLMARAENYVFGNPDLADTIRRLQAFQEAGADVLFAPGIKTAADIQAILSSIDRPLNVIMGFQGMELDFKALEALGVKRVSVGGSLARAAYGALVRAGEELRDHGTCNYVHEAISGRRLVEALKR